MADDALKKRADSLVAQAQADIEHDKRVDAFNHAQQAIHLLPGHKDALHLLQQLQITSPASDILDACNVFVTSSNPQHGQKLLQLIRANAAHLDPAQATASVELLLHHKPKPNSSDLTDKCLKYLLACSLNAGTALRARCEQNITPVFQACWRLGEGSKSALISLVLDNAWPTPSQRLEAIQGAFLLTLAQLIDAGQAHIEWAINDIVLLLRSAPAEVKDLIDADTFSMVLECLDIRSPTELKRGALLAIKLLLDLAGEPGQAYLRAFVTAKFGRGTNQDLIVAFSAASATFPILPTQAAQLFLTEGFLQSIAPKLTLNSQETEERRSTKLEHSALELLSAACQDKACREQIVKHCAHWLEDVAESGLHAESSCIAALILSKTYQVEPEGIQKSYDAGHLVTMLGNMLMAADTETEVLSLVEGLSYLSLEGKVRKQIAENKLLLQKLVSLLKDAETEQNLVMVIFTIFTHLVAYRSHKTEEQKKVEQLKDYAEGSKPVADDASLDDVNVHTRCKALLEVGVISPISSWLQHITDNIRLLMSRMLSEMSKNPPNRGLMAQQGAIKILLGLNLLGQKSSSQETGVALVKSSGIAIARILTSLNPTHVFSAALPAVQAVPPLATLLLVSDSHDAPDLQAAFEALRALTNLASIPDPTPRQHTIRTASQPLDDLLLSSHPTLQQAAAELLCNLMPAPECAALYADASPPAIRRLHVLLALADAAAPRTRRAARGALAALTAWEPAAQEVLRRDDWRRFVLGMFRGEDGDECLLRALVVVRNLADAGDGAGERCVREIKAAGGVEMIRDAVRRSADAEIRAFGEEVGAALGQD